MCARACEHVCVCVAHACMRVSVHASMRVFVVGLGLPCSKSNYHNAEHGSEGGGAES